MTAPITSLPAAVAALGALPMPAGPADRTAAVNASVARLRWLLAHPEAAATGRHATPGEAAEQRHLLDPALDYTRRQETK